MKVSKPISIEEFLEQINGFVGEIAEFTDSNAADVKVVGIVSIKQFDIKISTKEGSEVCIKNYLIESVFKSVTSNEYLVAIKRKAACNHYVKIKII